MFSQTELTSMRNTQEAHMMDTCVIYRVTGKVKDKRGAYSNVFDEGTESICGLQMEPLPMGGYGSVQAVETDGILRLPLGTVVNPDDEIVITKRFGETVEPRRYKVERYTNDGPSGCRAYLKVRTIA